MCTFHNVQESQLKKSQFYNLSHFITYMCNYIIYLSRCNIYTSLRTFYAELLALFSIHVKSIAEMKRNRLQIDRFVFLGGKNSGDGG